MLILRVFCLTGFLFAICCFFYFWYFVPYHLCFKEQLQLFIFSSSYLSSYFSKSASLACIAGDFLIQFFYFKGIGAVIVTLLLAIECLLFFSVLKHFSIKRYALLWSFLPVLFEWFTIPYSFSMSISFSFIIAVCAFLLYAKYSGKIVLAILIPLVYMMAGASVFLLLFLTIIYDIHCGRKRYVYWTAVLVFSFALPFFLRYFYLFTLKQAYFYPYSGVKQIVNLIVSASVILLFMCIKSLRGENSGIRYLALTLAGLVSVLFLGLIKTTDRKQEHLFGIIVESYHDNWDKVLEIAEKANLQNSIATCYTNMALSKNSLLGERLLDFYQPSSSGLLLPNTHGIGWFTIFCCSDAYYYVGDVDMAQHAAMLGLMSSPYQRSGRLVERLVETNMANGDIPVAMKYVRMLESTLFHKINLSVFENKPPKMTFTEDIIRSSSNTRILLEFLTEGNPDNTPALNYLLCYHLLNKDIPAFFEAYKSYYKDKANTVPKVYAQALLIYFDANKIPADEVAKYNLRPEIISSFADYISAYKMSYGDYDILQKNFQNTYWLFFHFANS